MVQNAAATRMASQDGRQAADPEPVESAEFLGSLYNLVVWKPEDAEHEYFRNHAPKVAAMTADFTLPSLDGGEVTLSSLRGKPVVMEFGSIT